MNKSKLKELAVSARKVLLLEIGLKIKYYDPIGKYEEKIFNNTIILKNESRKIEITQQEYEKRIELKNRIEEIGVKEIIEEVACICFNRISMTKYMEINNITCEVFKETANYVDILSPENLMELIDVSKIPEEEWKNNVEIVGWLYQYYILAKKEEVFSNLKRNEKISKENISVATQVFTPEWIVKYMLENSLGKLWLETHPNNSLQTKWKYYISNENSEKSVGKDLKPTDIRIIDPCTGSGNILVYAFRVLVDIYKSCGYTEKDIPKLILKHNIHGLDIDEKMSELTHFALIMEAMKYDKNILENKIDIKVYAIQESNNINLQMLEKIREESTNETIDYIINIFKDAKEYGAILKVENKEYELLIEKTSSHKEFKELLNQAIVLSGTYDIVVTNPPYMGQKHMNRNIKKYIEKEYKNVKADLFSVFIERNYIFAKKDGYLGFMTPYVWMFLSSYEKLRNHMISNKTIDTLIQFEYSAFDVATVPICSFVLRNTKLDLMGNYFRLTDFKGGMQIQQEKVLQAIEKGEASYLYKTKSDNFGKIPGTPIAYWASNKMLELFSNAEKLKDKAIIKQGLITGNNKLFIKHWSEVDENELFLKSSNPKWFPINKGGKYRKWYGNREYVVNWSNNGDEIKNYKTENNKLLSRPQNLEYNFKEHISWSMVTSGDISVRYYDDEFLFNVAGIGCFVDKDIEKYILGYLNSKVVKNIIKILNPTLNTSINDMLNVPIIIDESKKKRVEELVEENIQISKKDWDSFENSWDFKIHPFLKYTKIGTSSKLSDIYSMWEKETKEAFNKLKQNEEELNEIFIEICGLQDELTKEVDEKEITIRKANLERDVKSFLSYFKGWLEGRYSILEEVDTERIKIHNQLNEIESLRNFMALCFGTEMSSENLKLLVQ